MNNKLKCSALIALLISSGSVGLTSDVSVKLNDSIKNYRAVSTAKPEVRKISISSALKQDIKPILGAKPKQTSTLALNDDQTIDSDNLFTNSDTVTKDSITNNGGTGLNQAEGNLTVTGALENNSGSFTNEGTLSTGSLTNGGTIDNSAGFTNNGAASNTGTLNNSGTFKTDGLSNTGSGALNNTAGTFTATGAVTNDSSITNSEGAEMTFGGTFNNSKNTENSGTLSVTGKTTNSGTLTNTKGTLTAGAVENQAQGNITVTEGTVTADSLNNSGSITNSASGNLTVSGALTNSGKGDGKGITNSGNITAGSIENNGDITNSAGKLSAKSLKNATGSKLTNNADLAIDNDIEVDSGSQFENNKTTEAKSLTNNGGTVNNTTQGSLTITDAIQNETGTFTNDGSLSAKSLTNKDTFSNTASSFTITDAIQNESGTFTNSGSGNITAGSLTNGGTLNNSAEFTSNGTTSNTGTLTNSNSFTTQDFNNTGDGTLNNNAGTFTAKGAVTNDSSIKNAEGAEMNFESTFDNSNSTENSGTLSVTGKTTNTGNLTNKKGSLTAGEVENQAKGNITVTDGTVKADSMNNAGSLSTNGGSTTVTGNLENSGTLTNSASGEGKGLTVNGKLTNNGKSTTGDGITNSGNLTADSIENTGDITNTNSFTTKDFSNTGYGTLNNNAGTFTADGTVTNDSTITNNGTLNFNGEVESTGSSGSITNSGNLTLKGNASDYKGEFSQNSGTTTVEEDATFFGGTSSVTNGTLTWNAKSGDAKNLQMTGGTLDVKGNLTLKESSTIADAVKAQVEKDASLTLEGGTLNLDGTDSWQGDITLEGGTLGLNEGIKQNGKLTATTGNLNINTDYTFNNNSTIADAVKVNLSEDKTLTLTEGNSLTMTQGDDTWAGEIDVKGGDLTVSGAYKENSGLLKADSGNVSFEGADFYLDNKSYIEKDVAVSIDDSSKLSLKDGELHINDNDTWEGTVNLNDEKGTLHYWLNDETSKDLEATAGNLHLEEGSKFNFKGDIESAVNVYIKDGSTLNIQEGNFIMDSKDQWNGLIVLDEARSTLTANGVNNTEGGAGLQQTQGTSSFTDSNIVINDENSYIKGGDVTLDNSSLTFGKNLASGSEANFKMTNDSVYGIMNGGIDTANAQSVDIEEQGNFTVDISPRDRKGDYFDFSALNTTEGGVLNVSDFDFLGLCPVDRYINLQLFNNEKINEDIIFTATDKLIRTPVGYFGIRPIEGEAGMYQAYLNKYVPEEFRGQVATLAMYTNQLHVDDIVTNHFILHDASLIDNAKNANKYSAVSPLFAPYQRTYEDGGIWSKSYASFERLNMTQGLSVGNNSYGTLAGVDLPAVDLNEDWKFIPSGYVGYTGANQYYDGVRSFQNGGQLGVMGTFIKNQDFITSITAYGGGYLNEMSYESFKDETGNWFAGTAVKTAYNLHPFKDFIVQPNLFMSYNGFGKQNWGSEYGIVSMKSGMINAANIAPGLNLILSKETWSIYGTLQYMFFINDKIDGYAANIHLPNVRMEHGVMQYGIGATKTFNETFASYAQLNLFNAGITGIGVQFGLQYLFDLKLPWGKTKTKSANEKTHKKLISKA